MQRPGTGVLPVWLSRDRSRPPLDAAEIVQRWRSASMDSVWSYTGDWWAPAIEALAEAVADDRDLEPSAGELGRARAAAGVDMTETLDDVQVLFGSVLGRQERASVVRAVAVGWSEIAGGALVDKSCEDPLLRFATRQYLRTRLGEIYRQASRDGGSVPETAAIVVVETRNADSWTTLADRLSASEMLRSIFSGGETFCALAPVRIGVLTARDEMLAKRVNLLRDMLAESRNASARTWLESLPSHLDAALKLVDELSR